MVRFGLRQKQVQSILSMLINCNLLESIPARPPTVRIRVNKSKLLVSAHLPGSKHSHPLNMEHLRLLMTAVISVYRAW